MLSLYFAKLEAGVPPLSLDKQRGLPYTRKLVIIFRISAALKPVIPIENPQFFVYNI